MEHTPVNTFEPVNTEYSRINRKEGRSPKRFISMAQGPCKPRNLPSLTTGWEDIRHVGNDEGIHAVVQERMIAWYNGYSGKYYVYEQKQLACNLCNHSYRLGGRLLYRNLKAHYMLKHLINKHGFKFLQVYDIKSSIRSFNTYHDTPMCKDRLMEFEQKCNDRLQHIIDELDVCETCGTPDGTAEPRNANDFGGTVMCHQCVEDATKLTI